MILPSSPELTVLIPTRQRADVLESTLRTVIAQDYDPLTIVVSDNASTDETRAVVEGFNDPRIRYVATPQRLSMSANWAFALQQVERGWVTILGDDDGLLPDSLDRFAAIALDTGVDAVRGSVCDYTWPRLAGSTHGRMTVPMGRTSQVRSSQKELEKVLAGVGSYRNLPMLYNGGFVKKAILDNIREISGSYYKSRIPDVYSAMAISRSLDTYAYSYRPLAINGGSWHSTGSSQLSSDSIRRNADPVNLFKVESDIPYHASLPLVDGDLPRSIEVLVFESLLQTDSFFPRVDVASDTILLTILSRAVDREAVEKWSRLYAEMHGINYNAIVRGAPFHLLVSRARSAWSRLGQPATIVVDSPEIPLENVVAASQYAYKVLNEDRVTK